MEEMQNKLIDTLKEHNVSDEHINSLKEFMNSDNFKIEELPEKIEALLKSAGVEADNLGDKAKEIIAKVSGGSMMGM